MKNTRFIVFKTAQFIPESITSQLLEFYYLVLWKSYFEEENIWKPISEIQHLQKLTTTYYNNNSKKLIVTSFSIDTTPPMARSTVALTKKCDQPAKSTTTTTKQAKKSQTFFLLNLFRFYSSICYQGWEAFYQIYLKSSGFLPPSPIRVGRFFTKYLQNLLVFLFNIPLGQEVF